MRKPYPKAFLRLIPSLGKPMRKVTLTRTETGDEGTFGTLVTDSGFSVYSGELPWRGNKIGISCIPAGVYIVQRFNSPKHGDCYLITDVPGRTVTEIHKGNFCGDVSKGRKSDVEGCVLPGNALGEIAGQPCVIASGDALARLEADLEKLPFQLTVTWGPGLESTESAS